MEWNGEQVKLNNGVLSIAEAKSHFSEYTSRVAYAGKRYVIAKRGKPLAALVSIEDLENIKSREESEKISEITGKWKDFEKIEDDINNAYLSRKEDGGRDVSF